MIETKEQYEDFVGAVAKFPSLRVHEADLQRLIETIEALREVARAADHLVFHTEGDEEETAGEAAVANALQALPDWLTESS